MNGISSLLDVKKSIRLFSCFVTAALILSQNAIAAGNCKHVSELISNSLDSVEDSVNMIEESASDAHCHFKQNKVTDNGVIDKSSCCDSVCQACQACNAHVCIDFKSVAFDFEVPATLEVSIDPSLEYVFYIPKPVPPPPIL